MGGIGSGRRWQGGAATTEEYRALDVRYLKREGLLRPGTRRKITWSRFGSVEASIDILAEPGRVVLIYRHRVGGGDWQDAMYPVSLETTPCHVGGERHWFRCPTRGCGQRVALLYGGGVFACRHCHGLAYPSQREQLLDRAARRADRIREKLGWEPGILNGPGWCKPKGMHWRTYELLVAEHESLVATSLADFERRFGMTAPF